MSDLSNNFVKCYEMVTGKELNEMTHVELVGYYVKNFPTRMLDKLSEDICLKRVPYTLGTQVRQTISCLEYNKQKLII